MSYLTTQDLDSYYIDFYQKELIGEIEEQQGNASIENSINEVILLLKNSEKVIDFLVENSGKWEIKGNSIIFSTTTLSNEYNKLLDSLIEETTSEETGSCS